MQGQLEVHFLQLLVEGGSLCRLEAPQSLERGVEVGVRDLAGLNAREVEVPALLAGIGVAMCRDADG